MQIETQENSFIESWMRCLNNFSCRRQVVKNLKLSVPNFTFSATSAPRLNSMLKKRKHLFVVKNFGEECHWVFISLAENQAILFNTSKYYDMSDVEKRIKFPLVHYACSNLQRRCDCFCQTWSIVAAFCYLYQKKMRPSSFSFVVKKIWKMACFRSWVNIEIKRIKQEQ